jgi:hypothetical protein
MPSYAAAAQRQQLGLGDEEEQGVAAAASGLDGPLYPGVQLELQVGHCSRGVPVQLLRQFSTL